MQRARSIGGDLAGFDHLLPTRELLLLESGELRWRVGDNFEADRRELLPDRRVIERSDNSRMHLVAHVRRQPLGTDHRLPRVDVDTLDACSISVGTSGSISERFALVMASARNLPDFTSGVAVLMFMNVPSTWPPSRSEIAGAPPL